MDSANEIQKFALRFSTCDAAVTFVAALKEKLKGLEEAYITFQCCENLYKCFSQQCRYGKFSLQNHCGRAKHLGSYVPEMQPMLEYQDGKILYPPQSTLSQIPNEPFSSLPPISTTLLSGCFPNSTLDAGQTTVKQDPGLKSQILEKLKGLEEVGIQERETKSETSFQSDYNPGNEIIPSYVPEMQPRLEYQTGQIIHPRQFTTVEEPNMVKHLDSRVPEIQPRLEKEELPEGSDEILAPKKRARENQLEEARSLASLHMKRKPEGIDYDPAIRFQESALADEDRPALPTTTEGLEAQLDVGRNKISQRQDAPAAMLQANMLNDTDSTCKRPKLMFPSDNELKGIEKMGYASDLLAENEELPEGSAALLAKNSQTPREGTVAGKGEATVMEAENLARLTDSQTPLLGEENPELHPSHFSAGTQGKEETQTPDPMVSPSMTPGAAAALQELA